MTALRAVKTPRPANVLAVYERANARERQEGARWYAQAHDDARAVAREHDLTLPQAAGMIAALSPSVAWERNIAYAESCAVAFERREVPSGLAVYPANIAKAERIYRGESPETVLRGHKVRNFYALIAGAGDPTGYHVCIDGHAANLALGRKRPLRGAPGLSTYQSYQDYVRVYRRAAEQAAVAPHALQAITWLAWRRILKHGDQLEIAY